MKTAVFNYIENDWIGHEVNTLENTNYASLILCFASKERLTQKDIYKNVRSKFPNGIITLCSTSGEIIQDRVLDNSLIATAIAFEQTKLQAVTVNIKDFTTSYAAGEALVKKLPVTDLVYILILSDGSLVNGSELLKGITSQVDKKVLITGGLAGDGPDFKSTLLGLNEQPSQGNIVAIGFYGNSLRVTHGSQGGWDIFGLEKTVTKSSSNVLFEIDNQNALDLYKTYLGDQSENLPGAALLFPLSVIIPDTKTPVVRTILSINEEEKSMTFAGDIPVGSKVRFMKANFTKLTLAASEAAKLTAPAKDEYPDFSLLISCVGRKLILGEKTEEEVKVINETFKNKTVISGYYSYGEISPFNDGGNCQLHNQTMTITSFFEKTS
jgi:hypothetical protein